MGLGDLIGNVLSVGCALAVTWAGFGWVSVAPFDRPPGWFRWLMVGLVGLCAMLALRSLYWGIGWEIWHREWFWTWPNILFDGATLGFALALLRARWLVIPAPERARLNWLLSPLFPPKRCVIPWERFWSRRK